MVPAPSYPDRWDYWSTPETNQVELTCLMPNSIYIPLIQDWDATLQEIKDKLWDKAAKYPLYGLLKEMSKYMFQFVNSLSVSEDVDDETKCLRELKPVCGVLVLIEKSEIARPGEQLLNTQISNLIGKDLKEFDRLKGLEESYFRSQMIEIAEDSLMKREQGVRERLRYQYPPRLANSDDVPKTVIECLKNKDQNRENIDDSNIKCFLLFTKVANMEFTCSLSVSFQQSPAQHIATVLRKIANSMNKRKEKAEDYVLKVCGREEYLLGDKPLIRYLYIQEELSRGEVPHVMLIRLDKLPLPLSSEITYLCRSDRKRLPSEQYSVSSWVINKNYSCTVDSVGGLNVDPGKLTGVICQVGLFHGGKPLCASQQTNLTSVSVDGVAKWHEELTFPIKVYNIPRSARLCFVIYGHSCPSTKNKSKRRVKDGNREYNINKLAWANTMVFDYRGELRTTATTLYMWTNVADERQADDQLLHPLGTIVANPNTESCAALQVRFSKYDSTSSIFFPSMEEVLRLARSSATEAERADAERGETERGEAEGSEAEHGGAERGEALRREPALLVRHCEAQRLTAEMYEMHEQERKDIWASRYYIRDKAPHLLPKLISCVEWSERAEAASVLALLGEWATLPVESALELLDYAYADTSVRSFAVQCLAEISDEDLLLYLLQLVQALKHESYLMCDLAKFLLQRAFNNMTIGHYLFWHLRSEMHVPSVSVRFGLVLEAYCRGCQEHISSLMRQIACLDKLKWVSQCVSKHREIGRARAELGEHLREPHCMETLRNFASPLNPSYYCKTIKPEYCNVMDSKMRPLLLEFENIDSTGNNIRILLKIGDDLRQDMFTLQMLRIMDRLWKSEGYDFKLNPYNCISMEYAVGMIEVVDRAMTVANIQKQRARFNAASTISKVNLYQWLKEKNPEKEKFKEALHNFTMSCAGYCVATYVLGIADRHPDNIMVKDSGHLFHIDFGHFLGHFKQKFGFKRERVPFVLTHDFIHVINKGNRSGSGVNEASEFRAFKEHCETAFKILHRNGHLILSLFSMMISTGLPELSSEKDLQYLRETLVMDLSEEKAVEHFRLKFNEAMKNSWTTSFNWAFHNFDKNN